MSPIREMSISPAAESGMILPLGQDTSESFSPLSGAALTMTPRLHVGAIRKLVDTFLR